MNNNNFEGLYKGKDHIFRGIKKDGAFITKFQIMNYMY